MAPSGTTHSASSPLIDVRDLGAALLSIAILGFFLNGVAVIAFRRMGR
jgi:hypothetical protein